MQARKGQEKKEQVYFKKEHKEPEEKARNVQKKKNWQIQMYSTLKNAFYAYKSVRTLKYFKVKQDNVSFAEYFFFFIIPVQRSIMKRVQMWWFYMCVYTTRKSVFLHKTY